MTDDDAISGIASVTGNALSSMSAAVTGALGLSANVASGARAATESD